MWPCCPGGFQIALRLYCFQTLNNFILILLTKILHNLNGCLDWNTVAPAMCSPQFHPSLGQGGGVAGKGVGGGGGGVGLFPYPGATEGPNSYTIQSKLNSNQFNGHKKSSLLFTCSSMTMKPMGGGVIFAKEKFPVQITFLVAPCISSKANVIPLLSTAHSNDRIFN